MSQVRANKPLTTVNSSQAIVYHTFLNEVCVVYGFMNVDSGEVGWLAMTNTGPSTSRVMRNDRPQPWDSNDWTKEYWPTKGYYVHIQGAADHNGNIEFGASID